MTRWPVLLVVLAAAALAGCSTDAASEPAPAADQMVFSVITAGGLVPSVIYAMESPSIAVYADGRVLTAAPRSGPPTVPTRYEVARVDPAAVSSFVSSVQARGVIGPGTDVGSPPVTDLGTTTVTLNGVSVDAYAIDADFDADLTPAQRAARAALRAVIDQANALSAGAARSPFVPDRVVVYEVDPRFESEPATVGWPGPPPSGFLAPTEQRRAIACGELLGDPAEEVYRAASDNPGARWLVDGMTRVLAVNSLPLPGSCP